MKQNLCPTKGTNPSLSWGFETGVSSLLSSEESSVLLLTKGLLARKNLRVRRSGFNFSHSNCQGSPLVVHPRAFVERTEDYHQVLQLSSGIVGLGASTDWVGHNKS
jgi:hypothetical protein